MRLHPFMTVLIAAVPLLNACDPVVDYEKAILNSSSDELLLVLNNPLIFDFEDASLDKLLLDSAWVKTNARQLLTEGFDVGGSVEAYRDCPGYLEEEDTIFVFKRSGADLELTLTITQRDFDNTYRKISKSRCECVLEITDTTLGEE